MAVLDIHRIARRFSASVETGINAAVTSLIVESITIGDSFEVPAWLLCESEWIEVTNYAADTPVAGQATLTIVRAANGSSAASHAAGAVVKALIDEWEIDEAQDRLMASQAILGVDSTAIGVQRTDTGDDLAVVAEGTPSMTVVIGAGCGVVEGQPVQTAADTLTFSGPSANPRIDLVTITQYGVATAVTGAEGAIPSAPALPAGSMTLAQIYHRVGELSIKDADDSTNGYITDKRDFI
jgi:hypothetical protein